MNSLRRRLGRVVLVLLVGSVAQWFIADRMIVHVGESEMVTRLQHDSESLAGATSIDAQGRLQVDPRQAGLIYTQPYSGHYFVARRATQRVASRSFDSAQPFEAAPVEVETIARMAGPRGQPLLVLMRPLQVAGQRVELAVAEDLTALNGQLLEFRLLFVGAALAVLLAALALQAREIRLALRPVEAIRDAILQLPSGGKPLLADDAPAEIRPLLDEINRLMAFVERRLQQSRTSIGNLSHALKTPLAGLFRLLDDQALAAHPALRDSMQQQAASIRDRLERELRRARLAGDRHAGSSFDPAEEMPPLVELLGRIHADRGLHIGWQAPEHAIAFDREDLVELIGNLADNACKWAAHRVQIELRDGRAPQVIVSDDGPGCPPEVLQSLGERGVRSDEAMPGHGLGLAIARDIVEAAGGTLALARSAALGGLEVTATLGR